MKIEAEIITIRNGKIDEIKIMEQVYRCHIQSDDATDENKPEETKAKKKYGRQKPLHKHYKPANGTAFVKTYGTWIKEPEVNKVKLAINKVAYGYEPTADVIEKETGLRKYRVLAVLKYLRANGFVITKKDGMKRIYQPVVRIDG